MGKVVFLGVEGSGKTTLAMALAKAFARHADEGWYLCPEGRGAYNFATIAPNDFAVDGFPAQTSSAREMTWAISRDGKEEMVLLNIALYNHLFARAEVYRKLDEGERDVAEGRESDAFAMLERLGMERRV